MADDIKLEPSPFHRFGTPRSRGDIEDRRRTYEDVRKSVSSLSPGTRRLLYSLIKCVHTEGDSIFGHHPVSRAQLSKFIGKRALIPHDIKMLRWLCEAGLIYEAKRTLPLKEWRARGYEFQYDIKEDVLWCLLFAYQRAKEKQQTDDLPRSA